MMQHQKAFMRNPRMALSAKAVDRLSKPDREEIPRRAQALKERWGIRE
jgi:hypothetical protein